MNSDQLWGEVNFNRNGKFLTVSKFHSSRKRDFIVPQMVDFKVWRSFLNVVDGMLRSASISRIGELLMMIRK